MSNFENVENGALIEGYDSLAAVKWCTPTFLGCGACIAASAVSGQVTITIELKTPFGNVSKSFRFNANVSFTWQPFSRFKVTVSVSNFNEANGSLSFDLGVNPCVDVPFLGWKCFNYSHHFNVPLVLHGIENQIDDSQFSSALALHGAVLADGGGDAHAGTSLLHGDIYSNYLKGQSNAGAFPTLSCIPTAQCTGVAPICAAQHASGVSAESAGAFPTIPVIKCLPIPTVQCIPTITSCVTGVSPICATQHASASTANVGAFPTLSCIPTLTCIPTTVSCIPTAQCTGVAPICAAQHASGVSAESAGAFPTIPVIKCLPIPTVQCIPTITSCVTGVSPICATQHASASTVNVGAFPTLSCIPTLTCIPTTVSCIPTAQCTGVSPICATQHAGGVSAESAGAFPTIPVIKCLPIPTVQCIPTVTSCVTGVSPICATQHGNVGAAAVPTLPVNQCVPTVSCIPTLSCIPTVSCTGIPFIC
jgi:hypothetical protein